MVGTENKPATAKMSFKNIYFSTCPEKKWLKREKAGKQQVEAPASIKMWWAPQLGVQSMDSNESTKLLITEAIKQQDRLT